MNDLAKYRKRRQPLLLLDERTGKRQIVWGELDADADVPRGEPQPHHPPGEEPQARAPLRGGPAQPEATVRRAGCGARPSEGAAQGAAQGEGEARSSVYLTWDFTVASDKSLTARLLKIRDDAFAQLGDRNLADGAIQGSAPAFTITSVQDFTPAQDAQIARKVSGTFTVPCYLDAAGLPAGLALPLLELEAGRAAHPDAGQRRPGAVPVQHPARRVRPRRRASRSTATASSASTRRSRRTTSRT